MIGLRAAYLLVILFAAATRRWDAVLFNSIIFAGSFFVPLLGRKDDAYYTFDALIMFVFSLSQVLMFFNVFTPPTSFLRTVLGLDKLFHMAGGACLAMFAAIVLRKHTRDRLVFFGGIVVFALALGAAWEVFEWVGRFLPQPFHFLTDGYDDSMLDLVADTLGALAVALLLRVRGWL